MQGLTLVVLAIFAVADSKHMCFLHAIEGDTCWLSSIECKYVKNVKSAEKSLKDGTCVSQGYEARGESTTKLYPVVGDTRVTKFTKLATEDHTTITQYTKLAVSDVAKAESSSSAVQHTCSLYAIQGSSCRQSDIDCKYVKNVQHAENSLEEGTCASQGYTVEGELATILYPVIGDTIVTKFTKPASVMAQEEHAEPVATDISTSFTQHAEGSTHSFYCDFGHDICGQYDVDYKHTHYEKNAKSAVPSSCQHGTCSSLGYTVKGASTIKHWPVMGDITTTQYMKPSRSILV